MLEEAQGGPGAPAGSKGGLAHLLLNSYQERLIQNRLHEEQEREDGAREEDEEEDDGERLTLGNACRFRSSGSVAHGASLCVSTVGSSVQQKQWEPTPEEKALLREEFISQMHQRFLDGKDKDFNYRSATRPPTGQADGVTAEQCVITDIC